MIRRTRLSLRLVTPRLVLAAMLLATVLLVAGCGVPVPGPGAPAAVDIAGDWTGRLDRPGAAFDLGVTLVGGPGALTGTLDVPAQGIVDLPLAGVAVDGGTVRFALPGIPGDASFAGTLAADGSVIGGTFTQAGTAYPLVLRRGTVGAEG